MAVAILDFQTLKILTADSINTINLYQDFWQQVEQLLRYSNLTVIKMAAVRHFVVFEIQIFNRQYSSHSKYYHSA